MTDTIKVNVSGKVFEIPYKTLICIPYFKYMLEDCIHDNVIFVNRSSHIFKHVLGLVIDPLYPYPDIYSFELAFYGIDYDKDNSVTELKTMVNGLRDYLQDKQHLSNICRYHDCDLNKSTNSLFCTEHLNICAYVLQEDDCYKTESDSKYNYCEYHSKIGYLCNKSGCRNLRILGSKYCSDYCKNAK